MASPNNAKKVGDTTYTKIFVGGLAWETKRDTLKHYFEQFGEILDAVVINERNSGRSKGYGFLRLLLRPFFFIKSWPYLSLLLQSHSYFRFQVTFKSSDSAIRACQNPYPVIDGRRANCNLSALGAQRKFDPPPTGKDKFSTTYWPTVPVQGISFCYNQHIPQYAFPYPPPWYPGYPPIQEIYATNYVYGGQQIPIRWPSVYYHPSNGIGQLVPPACLKKARYPDPSSQELFTVVCLPQTISAYPSIPISGGEASAAGMVGTSPGRRS